MWFLVYPDLPPLKPKTPICLTNILMTKATHASMPQVTAPTCLTMFQQQRPENPIIT
ncbi:hypothetical protein NC653_039954 [Populus alba x Populus x berolinensis]|uniref:Uncharacterized protein n=1 Tax=Populus alba x Populus x berolinensis TaxID=444605 RepID=A0AAD6LE08_9ROSI|nr:hypothetical protein NC653_039954 [Populus alba x Populus x berolinensis]